MAETFALGADLGRLLVAGGEPIGSATGALLR